jgi:vancomycin resistance protein YoaR
VTDGNGGIGRHANGHVAPPTEDGGKVPGHSVGDADGAKTVRIVLDSGQEAEAPTARIERQEQPQPDRGDDARPDEAETTIIPVVRPDRQADAPSEAFQAPVQAYSDVPGAAAGPSDQADPDTVLTAGEVAAPRSGPPAEPGPEPTAPGPPPVPPVVPPMGPQDGSGSPQPGSQGRSPLAKVAIGAAALAAVGLVAYGADYVLSGDSVPRGVTVAGVDVGGLSTADAEAKLRAQIGPRADQPVPVQAGEVQTEIVPSEAGLAVDWSATLDRAGSQPLNPVTRLTSLFSEREIGVVTTTDPAKLTEAIDGIRLQTDRAPLEGNVVFEGATPIAVTPRQGQNLDGQAAETAFAENWANGESVDLPVSVVPVSVGQDGVDRAMSEVAVPAVATDLVVTGRDNKSAMLRRDQVGGVLTFVPDGNGGLTPQYNVDAAIGVLAPQLAGTEVQPKDATFSLSGGAPTVVPAVTGDMIEWRKTLEQLPTLLAQPGPRTTAAVYEQKQPALTTAAADKLGIRQVIGEFTSGGFEAASGVNIRLAASEINGAVVKPGETFSLNGHTGPRGSAEGYVESGVINNGRPAKAVGGGISQLATTLYNAAYFAGMEDAGHTEHSYYISRYPAAREATVFEGAIDLKFKNDSPTGVLIQAVGTGSDVTVRLWGTKTVDVESIPGERYAPTDPNTVTLPKGPGCIASSGAKGFTTSDTRVITDHATGQEISRDTRTVKYDPVPIVKCE